jgi:hypothetical protein
MAYHPIPKTFYVVMSVSHDQRIKKQMNVGRFTFVIDVIFISGLETPYINIPFFTSGLLRGLLEKMASIYASVAL